MAKGRSVGVSKVSASNGPRSASGKSKKRRFQNAFFQRTVDNQLAISLAILSVLALLPAVGVRQVDSFLTLSYRRSSDGLYEKGPLDLCYIGGWFLLLTLLRAFMMDYILRPLGTYFGIRRESKISRFAEQGWSVVYYIFSWIMGIRVMSGKPYDVLEPYRGIPLEQQQNIGTAGFWLGYPHRTMSALDKWYYLFQLAFWLQQLFVIHTEKRRKDYFQMLAHHIITCALIISSYLTHFTYMGNAVLVLMDFADIILSFAKVLRYIGFTRVCDILFFIFVAAWVYTRHYLYYFLVYSMYAEGPILVPYKFDPATGSYWTPSMRKFFLTMFSGLQVLLVIWLFMILKVIARVLTGNNADDNRSDSECSDTEVGKASKKKSK